MGFCFFRQRRNALAICLGVRGLVSLMVLQALALRSRQQGVGARCIRHVTAVISEIEFREIAGQVLLADAVERAIDATLQDREVAFNRVGMDEAAKPDIFVGGMVHGAVSREFLADGRIDAAFVRHQVGLAAGVLHDDRADRLGRDVGDVKRAGRAGALNEGHDRLFSVRATVGGAARVGHGRWDPRADRQRALHRQPFLGADGLRPRGAGTPARR